MKCFGWLWLTEVHEEDCWPHSCPDDDDEHPAGGCMHRRSPLKRSTVLAGVGVESSPGGNSGGKGAQTAEDCEEKSTWELSTSISNCQVKRKELQPWYQRQWTSHWADQQENCFELGAGVWRRRAETQVQVRARCYSTSCFCLLRAFFCSPPDQVVTVSPKSQRNLWSKDPGELKASIRAAWASATSKNLREALTDGTPTKAVKVMWMWWTEPLSSRLQAGRGAARLELSCKRSDADQQFKAATKSSSHDQSIQVTLFKPRWVQRFLLYW